jgi:hypothetical protein
MSTGTLIVPVNSASVGLRCFVRHRLEGAVQCSACSNVRAALKQVVFPPFRHLLFRIATYDWNILERRISGINGQNQRASRINEHLSACALPKRNIVHRGNFASIPCWTSFTAIFPLASSVDTASGINGQQQRLAAVSQLQSRGRALSPRYRRCLAPTAHVPCGILRAGVCKLSVHLV